MNTYITREIPWIECYCRIHRWLRGVQPCLLSSDAHSWANLTCTRIICDKVSKYQCNQVCAQNLPFFQIYTITYVCVSFATIITINQKFTSYIQKFKENFLSIFYRIEDIESDKYPNRCKLQGHGRPSHICKIVGYDCSTAFS